MAITEEMGIQFFIIMEVKVLARYLGEEIYDRFWLAVNKNHELLKKSISLTRDESVALYAYTNIYPPYYQAINTALRSGDDDHFLIYLLDTALDKLPIYRDSTVYRWSSPPVEQINDLDNGKLVTELGYVSTLKQPSVLTMCESDCLLISITHRTGRDISLFSDDFSSKIQEVLIPRASNFKKIGIKNNDFDIYLEQT